MKLKWWNKGQTPKARASRFSPDLAEAGRTGWGIQKSAGRARRPAWGPPQAGPVPAKPASGSLWSLTLVMLILSACSSGKPAWEFMPDMADQPALKAYEYDRNLPHHRSAFLPVPGTIPRGFQPYPYKEDPEAAGRELKNPLPRTKEVMLAGQKVYQTYCFVCHGERGDGNGTVVPPFPKPPSFHTEKVKNWPDGRIFHVITMGQNLMPSYASQVEPEKRWAAVHYLRALQKAQGASGEDVKEYLGQTDGTTTP